MEKLENGQGSLHGPVITYHLGKPMDDASFEAMPRDLQKEYLQALRTKYGFGLQLVAVMLGVKKEAVLSRVSSLGLPDWKKARLNTKNPEVISAREKFLEGYVFPKDRTPAAPTETQARAEPTTSPISAELVAFRVELTGPMDAVLIRLQDFAAAFGDGEITVSFEARTGKEDIQR